MNFNNLFIMSFMLMLLSCQQEPTRSGNDELPAEDNTVMLTAAQRKNAEISIGNPEEKQLRQLLRLRGHLEAAPQNLIVISSTLGGIIRFKEVLPGMYVNKGELIATMEDAQYLQIQQDYRSAKARNELAYSNYKRQQELYEARASSAQVAQEAAAQYRLAQAEVQALEQKLSWLQLPLKSQGAMTTQVSIRAPESGYITKVHTMNGSYTRASEVLFEMVKPGDIHITLKAYEKDIPFIHVGQAVSAYSPADTQKKWPCEVVLVGKEFMADRSTEVHCHINARQEGLYPGMSMFAEIETTTDQSRVLPEDAVVHFEGKDYVFIQLGENKFKMVEVSCGQAMDGYVSILQGGSSPLKAVVVKGAYTLLMALKNKEEE